MWPMMDTVINGSDLPPMMLSFSADSNTPTITMLDNIAATIKVEPDSQTFVSCSGNNGNTSITNSASATSPVMASFSTTGNTPTIVNITSATKLSTVSSASSGSKAPSCKVCGDESSGFHYGVDSCEGCKGFFRRCITQGMTHKCSNNEKCEITPFTRNSCQYCRLKKCFAVGMSREASRLGRRPKKLKDPNSDSNRSHTGNLPIAPYPSPAELHRMRMAELQRLLQANGTFKSEVRQAFQSAQTALQEQFGTTFAVTNTLTDGQMTTASVASVATTPATTLSAGPLNGLSTGMANGINTKVVNNSATTNMMSNMAVDGTTSTIGGFESGYSSMTSPSSSKSQSPNLYATVAVAVQPNNNHQQLPSIDAVMNGNDDDDNSQMAALEEASQMVLDCNMANIFGQSKFDTDMDMMTSVVYSEMANTASQQSMQIHAYLPQSPNQPGPYSGYNLTTDFGNANMTDMERIMTFVKQQTSDLRRQLIDQVTDTIVDAHMLTCRVTHKAVEEASHRVDRLRVTNSAECGKDSLCMWQQFVKNMVPEITSVVKFCKKLPGFTEIDQEDQIRLIKQGSFECLLCRFSMLVDSKSYEMFDPDMKIKCPREVVRAMPMGEFFEEFFVLADLFNPLKLTDGEIGLFTALLAMYPDRQELVNKKTITKIQALFYQALYFLMKKNHADAESLFMNLLNIIPILRRINEQHCMALNNIKMRSPDKADEFPALHKEVYFYSS